MEDNDDYGTVDDALNARLDELVDADLPAEEEINADIQAAGETAETAPETDPEPTQDTEPKPDPEPDTTVGSKEDPYTIKDFGEDEFIKIKIDGEEQVVSLREAIDSGLRRATFDKRAHEFKTKLSAVEKRESEVNDRLEKYSRGVINTFGDPDRAIAYLEQHNPDVLDQIALKHYPKLYEADQKGELDRFMKMRELQKRERLIEQRQKQAEEQFKREAAQRELQTMREAAIPALKKAVIEADFPNPTADMLKEIGIAWDIRSKAAGRKLDQSEMAEIATRYLRTYGNGKDPSRRQRKPRHRQAPAATRAAPKGENKRGNDLYDEWGEMSTAAILDNS